MKTKVFLSLTAVVFLSSFSSVSIPDKSILNSNSHPSPGDWEILFDGSGTDKWKSKTGEEFPAQGWKVENDLLFLDGKGGGYYY
jgi:hypothetical protein